MCSTLREAFSYVCLGVLRLAHEACPTRFKYDYKLVGENKYEFNDTQATVLAIKTETGFVEAVEAGDNGVNVGVVVDQTNFYAEQGGQVGSTCL